MHDFEKWIGQHYYAFQGLDLLMRWFFYTTFFILLAKIAHRLR